MYLSGDDARVFAQNVIDSMREALLVLDESMHIVSANRAFCRRFSSDPQKIHNLSVFELGDGGWNVPELHELLEKLIPEHGTVEDYEVRLRPERGGGEILSCNGRRTEWNGRGAVLLVIGKPEVTRDLLESEERLSAVLDALPVGVWITDTEGRILRTNPKADEIWAGKVPGTEDIQGYRKYCCLWPGTGKVVKPEEQPLARVLLQKERGAEAEYDYRRFDGSVGMMSASAKPIVDRQGELIGAVGVALDITERKNAEEQLRESEIKFSKAFHSSPILLSLSSLEDGTFLEVNDAFCLLSGYSREELIGHSSLDVGIITSETRRRALELIRKRGRAYLLDGQMRRKNGELRETIYSVEVIELKGKRYALSSTVDVTESRRAEEALRQSREDLRRAQEVAHIGNWHIDLNNELVWSDEVYRIFGIPSGTALTYEKFLTRIHPDDREHVDRKWAAALKGEPYDIEHRIVAGDNIKWVREMAQLELDKGGNLTGGFGTVQDITDRKLIQEQLEQNRRDLNRAQQVAHIGSWHLITSTDELIWSDEAYRMFGLPAGISFSYDDFLTYVIDEDREYVDSKWKAALQGESYDIEYRIVVKDRVKWVRELAELEFVDGMLAGGFGTIQDVTDRKLAQEALERRTEELAEANKDLESFSYSVSHDLRTPLRTIRGFADFLVHDYSDRLDEEGLEFLRRIDGGVDKMQALIDDMLHLSRVGRYEMNRSDVNLSAVVRDSLSELKTSAPDRQTEFIIEENVHADADPRLVSFALENLLCNAWKFTSRSEVTRIEFGTEVRNGERIYFVRDNGVGFDIKFAREIFDPFRRVHAEKEFGGTGVGLSIVQRVIGRHGGRVWAEGEEGKGAVFYFTL